MRADLHASAAVVDDTPDGHIEALGIHAIHRKFALRSSGDRAPSTEDLPSSITLRDVAHGVVEH